MSRENHRVKDMGLSDSSASHASSMRSLLRYNIVTERETVDARLRADAYVSTQPARTEMEKGRLRDIRGSRRGR